MEPRRARTRWLAPAAQAAAACLALSLAGCNVSIGIGSFDDGDAMIDPGNASSAVAAGFDTLAALAGPALGLSDEPLRVPAGERPRRALVPGTFDWLEWAAPLRGAALPVAGGRFSSSLTLACHSGTVRVTAVFLNPAVFGAGDTIDLEAAACRFDGVVFDGRVTMSVVSASGYPGTSAAWTARVSVGFSGWRVGTVALPLQARTVGGTAVLDARRFDALEAAIDFDSPALSVEPVVSGTARPRRTVELLSLRLDVGAFGGRVSGDFDLRDGRLAGTDLALLGARTEGVIALPASPPAFALGVLRLRAPDDSGVHADAFDATQIRLELDRFLDGSIDATQLTDWSRLRALL